MYSDLYEVFFFLLNFATCIFMGKILMYGIHVYNLSLHVVYTCTRLNYRTTITFQLVSKLLNCLWLYLVKSFLWSIFIWLMISQLKVKEQAENVHLHLLCRILRLTLHLYQNLSIWLYCSKLVHFVSIENPGVMKNVHILKYQVIV